MPMPPYVAPPEFIAYPNYLDLDDLVPGEDAARQTAELINTLRRASRLADGYCHRTLRATQTTETMSSRRTTRGYAFTLKGAPFVSMDAVSYTVPQVGQIPPVSIDPSIPYLDDGVWRIPLWAIPAGWERVQLAATNTTGDPVTSLVGDVAEDDTTIVVSDPTGIVPGLELRLPDPGVEEDIVVASGYTPGDTTIPLTSPLAYAHADGTAVDALPENLHEAVILWTMGLLARPANGGEMDPFSDTAGTGPTTEGKDPRRTGRGLIAGAKQILDDSGLVRPI